MDYKISHVLWVTVNTVWLSDLINKIKNTRPPAEDSNTVTAGYQEKVPSDRVDKYRLIENRPSSVLWLSVWDNVGINGSLNIP